MKARDYIAGKRRGISSAKRRRLAEGAERIAQQLADQYLEFAKQARKREAAA